MAAALYEDHQFPLAQQFAVAFSGGADSMALLHGLCEVVRDQGDVVGQITALHFNHRMSAESDHWQGHCAEICARLGVQFIVGVWDKDEDMVFTEHLAREARYQWFDTVVADNQVLLLGHHANDQVETVLLHLLQGRELGRVAGMPNRRALMRGGGRELCRPLLGFSGQSLRRYLEKIGERWVEDGSNQNVEHDRNFLRQSVLPLLQQRWPQISGAILGVAGALRRLDDHWQDAVEDRLKWVIDPEARRLFCLAAPINATLIIKLEFYEFVGVLRLWAHRIGKKSPREVQILQFYQGLLHWRDGEFDMTHCRLIWANIEIRGHGDYLYLMHHDLNVRPEKVRLGIDQLTEKLMVEPKIIEANGLPLSLFDRDDVYWCWRQGGERVRLPNRDHSSSLKKLWQQFNIPEWERNGLPYLVVDGEIVWVWALGMSLDIVTVHQGQKWTPRFYMML